MHELHGPRAPRDRVRLGTCLQTSTSTQRRRLPDPAPIGRGRVGVGNAVEASAESPNGSVWWPFAATVRRSSIPGVTGSGGAATAPSSQQARTSSPWSGSRRRSRPQNPIRPATEPRNWRQVPQLVDERWQTQQRDASG